MYLVTDIQFMYLIVQNMSGNKPLMLVVNFFAPFVQALGSHFTNAPTKLISLGLPWKDCCMLMELLELIVLRSIPHEKLT